MHTVSACEAVPTVLSAAVHTAASSQCVLPNIQVQPVLSGVPALFFTISVPADILFSAISQPKLLMHG